MHFGSIKSFNQESKEFSETTLCKDEERALAKACLARLGLLLLLLLLIIIFIYYKYHEWITHLIQLHVYLLDKYVPLTKEASNDGALHLPHQCLNRWLDIFPGQVPSDVRGLKNNDPHGLRRQPWGIFPLAWP